MPSDEHGGLLVVRIKLVTAAVLLAVAAVSVAWALGVFGPDRPPVAAGHRLSKRVSGQWSVVSGQIGRMVRLSGGTFRMGNDLSDSPGQRPAHEVSVGAFWMDEHEVTNRQFAEFVAQTGYITTAEQRGWSYVFDRTEKEWGRLIGADWRHPGGPDTSLDARDHYPVVHVSWYDAVAYARWADKQLPTEAEWEYAARSGLRDADYPWGREEFPQGRYQANYRQHGKDPAADGYEMLAPVKSFPPSRFGLYDLSGNVWEWCADWYAADYYRASPRRDPPGPAEGKQRVIRGGSWLSPENYRFGQKVYTRGKRPPEETSQQVGFRCVRRQRPNRY